MREYHKDLSEEVSTDSEESDTSENMEEWIKQQTEQEKRMKEKLKERGLLPKKKNIANTDDCER